MIGLNITLFLVSNEQMSEKSKTIKWKSTKDYIRNDDICNIESFSEAWYSWTRVMMDQSFTAKGQIVWEMNGMETTTW